jgi:GMP synthase (glutamine-hydrolysing)
MNAPVLIALHHAANDTTLLEGLLAERGLVPRIVRFHAGETDVDPTDAAGLVVLGGSMGAYETARYPFLDDTMRLLDRAIERDVPTLAICLGAQLLARVAGGRAFPGDTGPEWGYVPVTMTEAGQADPVLTGLDGEYFSFHSDSFALPTGVDLLAKSPTYPQAFRVGSALGLQFHPELSLAGIEHLLSLVGTDGSAAAIRRTRAAAVARQATTRSALADLLTRHFTGTPLPGGQDVRIVRRKA